MDGVASGETADADVTGWSSSDTSIATVSDGTVTGVAAGTAKITATDSSCETGYTTADASVTVTEAPIVDAFDHYEYENVNVSIWSTVDNNFPVGGTSYTIKATASATRYEVWTVSGKKATGETVTTTPHISGGGGAFTSIDEDSSSVDCSVGANTGAQRSADYTATATFGEGSYAKSGNASCTVIQDAYVKPDDFEWIDTSIGLEAGEGQVTANFKSTSNDPAIDCPDGIEYSRTISSTPDSDGYYSGTARFSASASCADGYSGTITGTAGSDSDDLSFDVYVMYTLESASLEFDKTQGGKDYYYVELTYSQSGGATHTANVTDSFSVGGSRGFSVSIAWDVEEDHGNGLEFFGSSNYVTHGVGYRIQATLTVDGNLNDASSFNYLLQNSGNGY